MPALIGCRLHTGPLTSPAPAGLSSSNTCVEWAETECGARAVLVLGQLKLGSLEINLSGSLGPACDSQPVFLAAVRNPEHTHTGTAVSWHGWTAAFGMAGCERKDSC